MMTSINCSRMPSRRTGLLDYNGSLSGQIGFQHHMAHKFNNCLPMERRLSASRTSDHVSQQSFDFTSCEYFQDFKPKTRGIKRFDQRIEKPEFMQPDDEEKIKPPVIIAKKPKFNNSSQVKQVFMPTFGQKVSNDNKTIRFLNSQLKQSSS